MGDGASWLFPWPGTVWEMTACTLHQEEHLRWRVSHHENRRWWTAWRLLTSIPLGQVPFWGRKNPLINRCKKHGSRQRNLMPIPFSKLLTWDLESSNSSFLLAWDS
jgi:hypothetical protein